MDKEIEKIVLESSHIENAYREILAMLFEVGEEVELLTNGNYVIQNTLHDNKMIIKELLMNTELGNKLKMFGFRFDISQMKTYLYDLNIQNDKEYTEKLIALYELNERVGKLEEKYINYIANSLSMLFNNSIFLKEEHKLLNGENKGIVQIVEKDSNQIETNYEMILSAFSKLLNSGDISNNNYEKLSKMTYLVFNFYKNGNKDLPVEKFKNNKEKVSSLSNFVI